MDQASDGRQALDRFADHPCDLVLMEVYMPYLDGLETCRRLRMDSDVPILMLSATGEATVQEMAFHSGANAFLPKPLELEGLLTWVRTISSAQIREASTDSRRPVACQAYLPRVMARETPAIPSGPQVFLLHRPCRPGGFTNQTTCPRFPSRRSDHSGHHQ